MSERINIVLIGTDQLLIDDVNYALSVTQLHGNCEIHLCPRPSDCCFDLGCQYDLVVIYQDIYNELMGWIEQNPEFADLEIVVGLKPAEAQTIKPKPNDHTTIIPIWDLHKILREKKRSMQVA